MLMRLSRRFALFCLGICASAPSHAQSFRIEQVIAKCIASYDKAKTYQGNLILSRKTPRSTTQLLVEMQMENDANGWIKHSRVIQKTQGGQLGALTVEMLDDGTALYTLFRATRTYKVSPHRPDRVSGLLRETMNRVLKRQAALQVSRIQQGNATFYVISGNPKNSRTKIWINANNYQLESLSVNRVENKEPVEMRLTMQGQKFNASIPASVFLWKIPAGYKKYENRVK